VLKILKYLLIAGSSWFITHSLYIVYDSLKETGQQADMTGVFGNKVSEDGTLSPPLKARLDKCIELYRKKQAKNILVSGGLGKETLPLSHSFIIRPESKNCSGSIILKALQVQAPIILN